jgi:uncharacterized protein YbjT (DUF2867 family)
MQHSVAANVQVPAPKILVLGATGGTGLLIVHKALARGYDVAVLARSAKKADHLNSSSTN